MEIVVAKSIDPDRHELTVRFTEEDLDVAFLSDITPEIKALYFDFFSNANDKKKVSEKLELAARVAKLVEAKPIAEKLNVVGSVEP